MTRRWRRQFLGDTPSQTFFDNFLDIHWLHGKAGT
jgi:hypothetical protein